MLADSVARPHWYSHGWNRLAYYRLAGVAAGTLPRRPRLGAARLAGRGRRLRIAIAGDLGVENGKADR